MEEAFEPVVDGTFVLSSLLPAEKSFNLRETQLWVRTNMWLLCCVAAMYVLAAHAGRRWMLNRERLELQSSLVVWNLTLAAFSVVGTTRMLPDLLFVWSHRGFRSTVCDTQLMAELVAVNYWGWLFALSKGFELLDTVFVVLRKHPLTWLHWVHHALTFLASFYLGSHDFGASRWFTVLNLAVHSCMYSYFALKAMHVQMPQVVPKAITLLQLAQMVAGLAITVSLFCFHWDGRSCPGASIGMCLSSAVMYMSFLALFVNFCRHRYYALSESNSWAKARCD